MSDHRAITYRVDGTPAWFDPDCAACAAGHHPGTIPTPAEVDAAGRLTCDRCPFESADPAAIVGHQYHAPARGWLGESEHHTMSGPARPEYRHPAAVGAEYRGPGADATAAEDADGDEPEPRPDTVYRFTEGGSIPDRAYCGRCLSWALASDNEPERARAADVRRAIGAPTAARCEACDLDGAPARWATATRGASLWRALLVGLDGLEVDPLTGLGWDEITAERPGLRCTEPHCVCTEVAGGWWARILSAWPRYRTRATR